MSGRLRRAWSRLLGTLGIGAREDDLAAEIDAHIQLLAEPSRRPRCWWRASAFTAWSPMPWCGGEARSACRQAAVDAS
jgi:hypothetical protein